MQSDWTDPAKYAHMRRHEAVAFAAEYLIRNETFLAESRQLAFEAAPGMLLGSPEFAARWGARFCKPGREASFR